MKKLILLPLFVLAMGIANAQVLLDQSTSLATGGIASHDFETAYNQYDCEAVDDFTVPVGLSWTIDSIYIYGQYSAGAVTTSPMRLTIYYDSNGTPGDVYYSESWTTDQDLNGDGDALLVFDCPVQVPAGRFWMSAVSTKTFGGGGQWYWTRDSAASGLQFKWKNPTGGFGTSCSTFTNISTCVSTITEPSTGFIMYGCAGGPSINSLGADTTICDNELLVLDAGTGGLSSPIFEWSNGDSTQQTMPTETGLYKISITDPATGCHSTSCINVTVNVSPMPINLENDTVCAGQTATFNGFANCGTCIHTWNDTAVTVFYATGTHGWHYIEIENPSTGCTGLDSVWLEVENTDPPAMAPDYQVGVCDGDSAYLSTVDVYTSYAWNTGETTQGIYVNQAGNYVVTVSTPSGCLAVADTIYVIIQPAPDPSVIWDYTNNWKVRLTASAGFQSYEWSTGETTTQIIANSTGTYYVTVTDEFGCTGVDSLFVEVTGLAEATSEQLFQLFPNPANETVVLTTAVSSAFEITDAQGRLIHRGALKAGSNQFSVGHLQTGIYTVHMLADGHSAVRPLMISR